VTVSTPDRRDSGNAETRSSSLDDRNVVLTVTGSIAAYKSCHLVRDLVRAGCRVQVVMTESAAEFVGPLTFAALSGRPVLTGLFSDVPPGSPVHLQPVEWGDVLVTAPATANYIGKLAGGLADDLATTIAQAFDKPILIAPAMNPRMWKNRAVQRNVDLLKERGVNFMGPVEGAMAGMDEQAGVGRMAEPHLIFDRIEELLSDPTWRGKRVVVTSGPTREPFDPVRFIGNRSSGRMGDAVARQARLKGADVILVRGRGAAGAPPEFVGLVEVETAREMSAAVKEHFDRCDLLVMTAAVADWTVKKPSRSKLKKRDGAPVLTLERTEDILAWACRNRKKQALIGFALETEKHLEEAKRKLVDKDVDLIALNDPTKADSSFGGDSTRLTLLTRDEKVIELPLLTKHAAARRLLDAVEPYLPKP